MGVQPTINPHDESRSWTLLDDNLSLVEPIDAFLAHFSAIGRSPNTISAYALDLQFCGSMTTGSRFLPELAIPPAPPRRRRAILQRLK